MTGTTIQSDLSQSAIQRFKNFLKNVRHDFKTIGFKATFKKYGWKLALLFFFYYLIRDSILYILIPWLIAYGVMK